MSNSLSAGEAVTVGSHEDGGAAVGALPSKTLDLSVGVDLVVLQGGHLDLDTLVLDLLGSGVDLLLALLGTTTKAEDQVEGGLLLDVVVGKSSAILELLAGEDQALLVGWDSFLILNLGLDIVDGVARFNLEGDRLAREGLDEDLHDGRTGFSRCSLPQSQFVRKRGGRSKARSTDQKADDGVQFAVQTGLTLLSCRNK